MKHVTGFPGDHSQHHMNRRSFTRRRKSNDFWKKKETKPYLLTHYLCHDNKYKRLPLKNHKPVSETVVWMMMGMRRSEGCHENHAKKDTFLISPTGVDTNKRVGGWNVNEENLISISFITIVIGSHTAQRSSLTGWERITGEWRAHTPKNINHNGLP